MTQINPHQLRKLQTLISKLDLRDQKSELCLRASDGRTESSRDLTSREAQQLIEQLQAIAGPGGQPDRREQMDIMRKKMLSIGYRLGYDEPRDEVQAHMKRSKVNHTNVSAWCMSDRCAHRKALDDLTFDELRTALSQFEMILKHALS